MPLPYSGQISLGNIANEQGVSLSNVSLRARSASAGKSVPDAMSEFYGYTQAPATYTHSDQIFGPNNTTTSGNITTYKPNVVITLTNFGGIGSGASAYSQYWVNGVATITTPTAYQYGFTTAQMTIATVGTRSAAMSLFPINQGGGSSAYAKVSAA